MIGAYFSLSSTLFLIIFLILFFKKEKIKTIETKIYGFLIVLTLFGTLIDVTSGYLYFNNYNINSYLYTSLTKIMYIYFISWAVLFFDYSNSISIKNNIKINRKSLYVFLTIISIIIFILPVSFKIKKDSITPIGIGLYITYIFIFIFLLLSLIITIRNIKNLKLKKSLPMFLIIGLLILSAILQSIFPHLYLINYDLCLIVAIMYFTIENPDLKMLNEYIKNKELVESSAEEKSNVLFKISQEVKKPLREINMLGNNILDSNKVDEMHNDARNIIDISLNVGNIINNVLDITDLDKRNVKIVNTTYNIYNLFSQIIYLVKEKENKVEFKYSINNGIPKELYGDFARLKQIICSILNNSFKNTENGYVDLDISNIIKYDICRLIITISDTGKGMSLEEINTIMEDTSDIKEKEFDQLNELNINLKLVKKLIDIQGGTMMICSDERGTVVTVVIDQKFNDKNKFTNFEEVLKNISNKQRVLIVDDDYSELSLLSKEFKRNGFEVVTTMYGKDCINRIANNEQFDYILLDDEMEKYNAVYIISELSKICDISKLKVIVLLGKDKESIKKHYLEDYPFVDYLLKENYKSELKRIKETN